MWMTGEPHCQVPAAPTAHEATAPGPKGCAVNLDQQVGRIVLVATSAWTIPKQDRAVLADPLPAATKHGELLRAILRETAGEAWICRDYQRDHLDQRLEHVPATLADPLIDAIERDVVERLAKARIADTEDDEVLSLIVGLRHRVFMNAERFRAVTDERNIADELGLTYYVSIDLRFYWLQKEPLCYLGLSVWSAPPWHDRYRPPGCPPPTLPTGPVTHSFEEYERGFGDVARAADQLVSRALDRNDFEIFDRKYWLPVFWIAVPTAPDPDPMRYLKKSWRGLTNRLAATFLTLGDVRDCVASTSVLNGEFLTVRRFHRIGEHEAPSYLIMPGRVAHTDRSTLVAALAAQEDQLAQLLRRLTDIEAGAGARLDAAQRDLPIWENSLDVYHAVAERAYILWDGLATHLPMRKWLKLARVHRAVELLHQILLQGIADLAHLTTLTRRSVIAVDEAATELMEKYDKSITERHAPGQPNGLRAALTRSGVFERVRSRADHVAAEADRVRSSYNDLLQAIANAFDERRVRESDALQKGSALLGVSLAMVGVVTVLDATIRMKPDDSDFTKAMLIHLPQRITTHLPTSAAWVSLTLGLILASSAVWAVIWLLRLGILGSRRFRKQYDGGLVRRHTDGVWRFLKEASTDGMETFSRSGQRLPSGKPDWDKRDTKLTADFVRIWDRAVHMKKAHRHDRMRRDIGGQSRQIEQWGLHALLLTERARRMYQYPLPALTTMYRCAARLPGSFLDYAYVPLTNVVPFVEFVRALGQIGLTEDDAKNIDDWLARANPATAEQARRLIAEDLGIRADMDDFARERLRMTITQPPPTATG